ncbi:hypothetical protein GCM10009624_05110 [Gordonia sinesedis]
MNDRDRNRGPRTRENARPRDAGRGRDAARGRDSTRSRDGRPGRPAEPPLPEDVAASDLDQEARRDLLTLDKANAERVARHLVMVTRLLEEDPRRALDHARAARGRAARVGLVRETLGIAAYNAGEWQEALSELRAARRITGSASLLPLIADAERGLGRPDRAIEIARSAEGRSLTGDEATEMRIVEAGARLDLDEPDKAVVTLQGEDLTPGRSGTAAARLFYAYASALAASGRDDDALTWFMNAAAADVDDVTDAEWRLMDLAHGSDEDGDSDASGSDASGSGESDGGDSDGDDIASQPDTASQPDAEGAAPRTEPAAVIAPSAEPAAADDATPSSAPTSAPTPAPGSLAAGYDALLLDLDGTVFAGRSPIPGAADALAGLDLPQLFVTNNASRRPAEVATHLDELGFSVTPEQIVTSAQTGARLLAEHLEPGSRALVLGTDGLAQEVREVGIGVTRSADDRPAAVIQGYSPDIGWAELSEAALAIRAGALWVATNVDATLPSERGLLVGNGSLVAAVANATGAQPLVAGKPAAPLMADAIARSGASTPLVVGDRLDTDIQGAHSVGLDSLLVLTGVSTPTDLLLAPPEQRPTYVADGLAGLFDDASSVHIGEQPDWAVDIADQRVTAARTDPESDDTVARMRLLPALAHAVWAHLDAEQSDDLTEVTITGADADTQRWIGDLGLG